MSQKITQSVMVIEDDEDTRAGLVELLDGMGFTSVGVGGGEAALRMLRDGSEPGVILLDLMMPGMCGWDFRCEQMADDRLTAIPVVAMTALGTVPDSHVQKMGRVVWLQKPFSPSALTEAIAAALRSMTPRSL